MASLPWLHQRETDMCVEFTTDNVSMAIAAVAASKGPQFDRKGVIDATSPWR
jgi:hypothetical protein